MFSIKDFAIARYFVVGGIAASIDISIFAIFAKLLGFNYLLIGAIGFIIATLANYLLSIYMVFESEVRFSRRAEIILVYFFSIIGLLIHLLILYLFIDLLGFEKLLSKFIATGSVFLWNYTARAKIVFSKRHTEKVNT
ncbi:MAG: GtrA family protein [Flexistipes sinusarabici]|uniref:GtrA family protein n=1 Tax=Flexistipes sinusarabici TaxID=2352 RepID=A0A5D0MS74_FLESI|nr:GtrA family protein [Flexistipes sinusarabici]TYB33909.1 MAG: GtrA family protein [Flexistipes sinusarabici]